MELSNAPSNNTSRLYVKYQSAHIDYVDLFLKMYITYNAWYREVTATTNDRQAISTLKKRFVIWDDYCQGKTLKLMVPYMERLAELTQQESFPSLKVYWDGEISSPYDWKSLIEFWYQLRCLIVHGAEVRQKYAWLAYETLDIFMGEIIERMQNCFTSSDLEKLTKLSSIADPNTDRSPRFNKLQHNLYNKYINSPNVWQVDMQRASETTG